MPTVFYLASEDVRHIYMSEEKEVKILKLKPIPRKKRGFHAFVKGEEDFAGQWVEINSLPLFAKEGTQLRAYGKDGKYLIKDFFDNMKSILILLPLLVFVLGILINFLQEQIQGRKIYKKGEQMSAAIEDHFFYRVKHRKFVRVFFRVRNTLWFADSPINISQTNDPNIAIPSKIQVYRSPRYGVAHEYFT